MEIIRYATAGTLESSDVYVEIEPGKDGISIQLESVVLEQFGDAIQLAVQDVLKTLNVENAKVRIADRGALECVLRARVETAVLRGKGDL